MAGGRSRHQVTQQEKPKSGMEKHTGIQIPSECQFLQVHNGDDGIYLWELILSDLIYLYYGLCMTMSVKYTDHCDCSINIG